ncbi:unnamed protein product [Ceutorhynchus assimilis]|uniref:O-acyltransferase WSD1 C-terminal domain-containing protein n=1 Tax=Ceutorhynchus assimilis TaxID=467358 RepID=A0A9N9MA93_9CUCU|nr:unnamed protein product [Ceutorhynchus assimilis]
MNTAFIWLVPFLSPFIMVLFAFSCCIFWIYRKIVDILLRIRLGDKYGGLLNYGDAFSVFNDISPCMICTMVIVKSDKEIDMVNLVKSRLQKMIFDSPQDYSKMTSTLHTYAGYGYFLKNSVKLNESVKTFPEPQNETYDEEYVKKMVEKAYNSPLPYNNTATWEIVMGEKPMVTKSGGKYIYRYPVHMRFHHLIGDGASKVAFICRLIGQCDKDFGEEVFNGKHGSNSTKSDEGDYYFGLLKNIFETLKLIFYIIFFMLQKRMELIHWRASDNNALHGVELSGKKIMVWKSEESVELVPLTKKIKNALPGMKFGNVVFAAVSAAFANYFKKYDAVLSNSISVFSTLRMEFPRIEKNKPIPMENGSTAVLLELPIKEASNLKQLLLKVKQNSEQSTYFEALSNQLFMRYLFALFPLSIRTQLHDSGTYTAIISNLPAGKRIVLHNDCYVEKMVAAPPNLRKIGVGIVIITYDDRYQIGLLVDKALIASQKQAQELVDDVFCNIRLLAEEIIGNKTKTV